MLAEFIWLWAFQVTYYTDATRQEAIGTYSSGMYFETRDHCMEARMRAHPFAPPGSEKIYSRYTYYFWNDCVKISKVTGEKVNDPLNSEVNRPGGALQAFGFPKDIRYQRKD